MARLPTLAGLSASASGLPSGSTPSAPRRKMRRRTLESRMAGPYDIGLDKNAANFVPLTPIGFLLRSAEVYPRRISVIHGERRYTWRETLERCRRLASALAGVQNYPGMGMALALKY